MRPGERLALAVILGLAVLVCGTAGATAYAWHRAGSLHIAIHESQPGGNDLSITLPGFLVNAAIALCPIPADPELHARLADVQPALRAVASELASMPDAVLVDVKVRRLLADLDVNVGLRGRVLSLPRPRDLQAKRRRAGRIGLR